MYSPEPRINKIVAICLSLIMLLPVISIPADGHSNDMSMPLSPVSDDMGSMELEDLGNGRYNLVSDYIKGLFQVSDSISDIVDPIGTGTIGATPMEILAQVGEDRFVTYEYGGSSSEEMVTGFAQGELTVSFAARLIKDGSDFVCQLSCVEVDGGYVIQLDAYDGSESFTLRADEDHIGFLNKDMVEGLPIYQSINLLQYEVADFDGDGSEEIAFLDGGSILFVELDDDGSGLEIFRKVGSKYSDFWLDGPVDLVSADYDLDGIDELIMLRSDYTLTPGNNESTWIAMYDIMETEQIWEKLRIDDPDTGDVLDMVMVSGSSADIDGDRYPELVIGGYLWDNSNTDKDHLRDPDHNAGELFLSYLEFEDLKEGVIEFRGTTVLKDDDGTATTRYTNDSEDKFKKHYKFNDHDSKDSSIYVTDEGNYGEFTRSMNWSNWTVPLMTGTFRGIVNGNLSEQVFFDVGMYEFNGTYFELMGFAPKFTHLMDENNVICNFMESGLIESQSPNDFTCVESLFVSYQVDLNSHTHYGDGELEVAFVIYDYDGTSVTATYGNDHGKFPYGFRIEKDWDGSYNPMPIIADLDNDSYYAELVGHLFTYTDPTVIAVISAVPYQQDLADVLILGSDQVGVTGYSQIDGTVTGSSWNNSFQVGGGGSFGNMFTLMQAEIEVGYNRDDSWFEETTTTFTTEFQSSHDSIAMYVTPVDVYFYNVTGWDDDMNPTTATVPAPFFGKPYHTIFDVRDYSTFVDNYNAIMKGYLGDDHVAMEKITFTDNVEGDISSYDYGPNDPIAEPKSIGYDQEGNYSTVSTSVEIVTESGRSKSNGAHLNFDASIGSMFATANFSTSDTVMYTKSQSDLSGTGFSVILAQGNENNYMGDRTEAEEVLSQYTMGGTMWAEKRTMNYGTESVEYAYVGFTVDRYTIAPKMGSVIPNVYVPDGTDEDDIFNPTSDSICLQITVPGTDTNLKVGDLYALQMEYQGRWYDVCDIFDLGVETYDGSAWNASEGSFVPEKEDRSFWVRVSGLSVVSDLTFEFRLDTIGMDGNNPTLPVTGYKDTRNMSDMVSLCDKGITSTPSFGSKRCVIIDRLHFEEHGSYKYVLFHVDAAPGERVDILLSDGDGDLKLLSQNMIVYSGGYVVFQQFVPNDPYSEPVTVVVLGAVLIMSLVILAILRR